MSPKNLFEDQAVLKVVGVGGAGCNALNRMVESGVEGVEFLALNTDIQNLDSTVADDRILLGESLTRGLGVGGDPEKGAAAAKESERQVQEMLKGADMVFVAAGMGGGTGTGAAPRVARLAHQLGILTVAVVTKPFLFEGPRRKKIADKGVEELGEYVDTIIVIPNDRLIDVVEKKTSLNDAFSYADDVLRQGVQGISDIVLQTGMINVDFADVQSVLKGAGRALIGMGSASGQDAARTAAEAAVASPLLETRLDGAQKLLVNVTAGSSFSLGGMHEIMNYLTQFTDQDEADIYMGHVLNEDLGDEVRVTILAAGMATTNRPADTAVFTEPEPRARARQAVVAVAAEEQASEPVAEAEDKPLELDEIDLDIQSYLSRRRQD